MSAPLDTIPLLIRGGYILPTQNPQQTTAELRNTTFEILVALNGNGEASGKLYWDDGDSLSKLLCVFLMKYFINHKYTILDTFEENRYCLIEYDSDVTNTLRSNVVWWACDSPPNVSSVAVLGVNTPVTYVAVNKLPVPFEYDTVKKVRMTKIPCTQLIYFL